MLNMKKSFIILGAMAAAAVAFVSCGGQKPNELTAQEQQDGWQLLFDGQTLSGWRDYNGLHFIQCACKFTDTCTTCNNEENRSKRVEIKELIRTLKQRNPFVEGNIFKSVENVNLDTVVAYKQKGVRHHFLDQYDEGKI